MPVVDGSASVAHAKIVIATLAGAGRDLLDRAYREIIVLERALTDPFLTDPFSPEEHRRLCEFLDRATATLVEQTPTAPAR